MAICRPSALSLRLVAGRIQADEHADLAEAGRDRVVHIARRRRRPRPRARRRGAASCSRRSWRPLGDRARRRSCRRDSAALSSSSTSPSASSAASATLWPASGTARSGRRNRSRSSPRPWRRCCASAATPIRPSAATRPAFFAALARPLVRSQSTAASMSPLVSVSAALQSIMPAPVFSRSSFTMLAVMSPSYLTFVRVRRLDVGRPQACAPAVATGRGYLGPDLCRRLAPAFGAVGGRARRFALERRLDRALLGGADDPCPQRPAPREMPSIAARATRSQ